MHIINKTVMTAMTHGNRNKNIKSGWLNECDNTGYNRSNRHSTPTAYRESYQGPSPLNPASGQWEASSSEWWLPIGQIRV